MPSLFLYMWEGRHKCFTNTPFLWINEVGYYLVEELFHFKINVLLLQWVTLAILGPFLKTPY